MTPVQKIKWAILAKSAEFIKGEAPPYPCENVDALYDEMVERDLHWDAREEIRVGGIETGLHSEYSRHYESIAVAMKMPDDSWVGWTYFYGGGKYGQPEGQEWIANSYDVKCKEEVKTIVVKTFSADA